MEWTSELDSRHSGAILRLINLLDDGRQFCLVLAEYNHSAYRDRVIGELASQYPEQAIVSAAAGDLLTALQQTPTSASVIHVIETQHWFADHSPHPVVLRLNQRREWLAQQVGHGIVVWLSAAQIDAFAHAAPDLWAWRKAVVDFCNVEGDKPTQAIYSARIDEDNSDYADKQQRLSEIGAYLERKSAYSLADAGLWLEKSRILYSIGELDAALDSAKQSLTIRQEHHDKRAMAVSYGDIADIHEARGELDEALRIRREEELLVYEALGDKRGKAVTMGKIADVLQARGELDEALRIRREEELPVYEALGDKREKAVAMGKIADVLQARGDLDEALRIYREEALPVYEALGDKRGKAVNMGKIAGVLQVRGDLDEALRIYREEALPVFEALGDKRLLLIGQANLAGLLQQIDPIGHAGEIRRLLTQALASAEQLNIPEQRIIKERLAALSKEG